jgi:uncharacterized membrane protein
MKLSLLISSAVAVSIAAPVVTAAVEVTPAAPPEKCYGINAAGMNDCASNKHSCAGESKTARGPADWIIVPAGTCAKIHGGSLKPKKV